MKIDLVVTRHDALVDYLLERGIIAGDVPVMPHVSISDVKGKHVVGVLPHHLSALCASITEIPMTLTLPDREAMQRGDLSLDRVRAVAGVPVTYQVFGGDKECRKEAIVNARDPNRDPMAATVRAMRYATRGRMRNHVWGSEWPDNLPTVIHAQMAAMAQIPHDLMGNPTPDETRETSSYSTACGHERAEACKGAFRHWSSGMGWSAWVMFRASKSLAFYMEPLTYAQATEEGLSCDEYETQAGGYPQ